MDMKKYIFGLTVLSLVTTGCEKQYLPDDGYIPESYKIDIEEKKNINFFETSGNFNLTDNVVGQISSLLKETRSKGIENISFMLVSNKTVPVSLYQEVKDKIFSLIRKHGFLESRVIDAGMCVYSDAKCGIRIDVLQYNITEPDCGEWTEYIGDTDTNKNLPKYGVADIYNLKQMIANPADLKRPRTYKGQDAKSAIAAMNSVSNSAGGGATSTPTSSGGTSTSSVKTK